MTSTQKIVLVLVLLLSAWGVSHLVQYLHGEWYAARFPADYYDNPDARIEVACPAQKDAIVIVAFGQSNSANYVQYRAVDTTDSVYNFAAGKCYLAKDPLLGADGDRGSLWIKLAQKMAKKSHKKVVIQSFGVGNTSITQWADEKGLGYLLFYNLSALKPVYQNVDYFFWVQGETDVGMTPEIYRQNLLKIISTTKRFYPTSLFALSSTTYCFGKSNTDIAAIQKNIRNVVPSVIWLGDTDQFNSAQYRWDDCHLTLQGVDAVGAEFSQHLLPTERKNLPISNCCAE